jgi:fumarate hydratase class II
VSTTLKNTGNFQLNVYKPIIVYNLLESITLIADALSSFDRYCAQGLTPNVDRIDENLHRKLMLATALNKHIGYNKASAAATFAHQHNTTLKNACLELGYASASEFDQWVNIKAMVDLKSYRLSCAKPILRHDRIVQISNAV